jgi:hypothetical protein
MQTSVASSPERQAEKGIGPRGDLKAWITGAALIGFVLKLTVSYFTFGTNDAFTFYAFARSLSDHGLAWTYQHGTIWLSSSTIFNHPPLTAYFLRLIYHLNQTPFCQANGLTFPFLLRLPGIIADFVVVMTLLRLVRCNPRLPHLSWGLIVLALSPVSLMVSGFHGNTDPVMVMFLVLAGAMCVQNRPWLCGLFFGLSCQVKIIPLLFVPVFIFFWMNRRAVVAFAVPFVITSIALCLEPLIYFPGLYIRNVVSYGSFWGIWGITYWLRLTGLPGFSRIWYEGFTLNQTVVVDILKAIVVITVCVAAWRRRKLDGVALIGSIGIGWIAFFILSPGVCAQYLVWLAPFLLFLSPRYYLAVTATSALFLFFFYNTISHGLPWYFGVSTNPLTAVWTPWTAWPWATLIVGAGWLWRKAKTADPNLKLVSLATVGAAPLLEARDSVACFPIEISSFSGQEPDSRLGMNQPVISLHPGDKRM